MTRKSFFATPRALFVAGCVLVLVLILLPFALSSYHLELASKMLIFALFAMSLDLLLGYAGMASLGHAAFFGVAAYTMALLLVRADATAWLAFPAGAASPPACSAHFSACWRCARAAAISC